MEDKIIEWRPDECGTRIGDVVIVEGASKLKVKCRRCSKRDGIDVFHYIDVKLSPDQHLVSRSASKNKQ